ncbi:MAG: hypothetical protein QXY49_00205 [Thermofilaceae archaeon]
MSWQDAAKKALLNAGARVEDGQKGLLIRSEEERGATFTLLVRRLQMSLDRKVELVGTIEVSPYGNADVLREMLASSFEVTMKGFIRKSFAWKHWDGLHSLERVFAPIVFNKKLLDMVKSDNSVVTMLREASPDLLEVFPEIMSSSFMEAYLVTPAPFEGSLIKELISKYLKEPERLAWCIRLQFLYGSPRMPVKIQKNYQLALQLGKSLKKFTEQLCLYISSSHQRGANST